MKLGKAGFFFSFCYEAVSAAFLTSVVVAGLEKAVFRSTVYLVDVASWERAAYPDLLPFGSTRSGSCV